MIHMNDSITYKWCTYIIVLLANGPTEPQYYLKMMKPYNSITTKWYTYTIV